MDLDIIIKKSIELIQQQYRLIGEGRNRLVFLKDDFTVIKVPKNGYGLTDNEAEANLYKKYGKNGDIISYAECKINYNEYGLPLLEMERVIEFLSPSEAPDWAGYIDCAQVGKNKDGIIVAYDFGST